MLEAVLREGGLRTGLYISPHLGRLGERVQVDRRILTEPEIVAYVHELWPVAERIAARDPDDRPSFFEFMTAMAFLRFARARCQASVIEVGLGGRLDATNIVEPDVCIITSLGVDHAEYLGDTVEKIAAEKAGIIKPGRPVVIGRMPAGAEAVVRAIARERGSRVIGVAEEFGDAIGGYPTTNLEGEYQQWNAATATLAARALPPNYRVTEDSIRLGLARVDWPGRWQRLGVGNRLVILDASHNPEGAGVLDSNLRRLVAETGRAPVVVTGALGAGRASALLEVIVGHASEIHLVVPKQARACTHAELESLVPGPYQGRVHRASVEELFPGPGRCTAGNGDEVVVVTGSLYLLGEILARLEPQRGAGEDKLQDF
jgi:dihydrofolate synthase/folylpolyglutamate synthase